MKMIIFLVVLFVIVVILYYMKKSKQKQQTNQPEAQKSQNNVKKTVQDDKFIYDLVQINIKARIEDLPQTDLIEKIIDQLTDLIPQMQKKFPEKEITWQTEKIGSTYLPDLVTAFIALNNDKRKGQNGEFRQSLESLKFELTNIYNLLSNEKVAEFDMKTAEISIRFSNLLK